MTTTLRPTGPLQQGADGAKARSYEVCVNSRPVGAVDLRTDPAFGPVGGVIGGLRIDEPDRGRGRGTVAALAAEEVLRGWGCDRVRIGIPADATAALRMADALGYTLLNSHLLKELPGQPPELPSGVAGRRMREDEFPAWLAAAVDGYARSWTERGMPEARARAKSEADHRENLPDGPVTPGVALDVLVEGGRVVGYVWVAEIELDPGRRGAFVFDVEVAGEHRGRGHGRSLMLLAEREALAAGARLIKLNVFAANTPAVRLYASLGYREVERFYAKRLL
ncbi:GNAT family N-acetyltransferase [Streptomyces sp. NBC_01306]|uniref:GNAT family N-acetyltransferase n=1 Tax=Streptomyces sp. NBC_01306 TaxID=2903819 RepID=UPI0022576603|nr:GNAT family N-acetyltransferase [Streptomyces sp. NBC_01306]MCX4727705.1 GNAT family N-acetyltransferase [Streptomyces sp. NBC_01306]